MPQRSNKKGTAGTAKGLTGREAALAHLGTDKQCSFIKDSGDQCRRHVVYANHNGAIVYGKVCVWHGGKAQAKNLKAKAKQKRLVHIVRDFGAPIEGDPADFLLQQVWECAGNVARWRELVQRLRLLGSDPVAANSDEYQRHIEGLIGPDHLGNLQPHVILKLYNEERDRLVKLCKTAIECGLQERQTKLAEQQTRMIVEVVLYVIESQDVGLSTAQQEMARRIAAGRLRELNAAYEAAQDAAAS